MAYRVSRKIAVPATGAGRDSKYPFPELEIGESFEVVTVNEKNAARKRFERRGQRIVTRMTDNGFRIWRIV
tara:strand:+ start:542 stop:754 length:213 start_codon:yes stop_codon:yes gene_type:complete